MIRLAAKPLVSPLVTSIAAASEVPVWPGPTFTPLRRQRLEKIWRISGFLAASTVDALVNSPLNFYYGSIAAANLIGTTGNFNISGINGFFSLFVAIEGNGVVTAQGVFAGIYPITGGAAPQANLSADSAVIATVYPAAAEAGLTVTLSDVVCEEVAFEDDDLILHRG
jgi:hypothetical protein